jgi:hypothetical protein
MNKTKQVVIYTTPPTPRTGELAEEWLSKLFGV